MYNCVEILPLRFLKELMTSFFYWIVQRGGRLWEGYGCTLAGVSLIEEIGGYSILNRRVPLRFLWLALFNT